MLRIILPICGAFIVTAWLAAVPQALAAEPAKVFVVNTQDACMSLVDMATMKEEKRFPVGSRPYGIAVTPDARMVAVASRTRRRSSSSRCRTLSRRAKC